MNSVEALDLALRVLRARRRRLEWSGTLAQQTGEAIDTLEALRELIAERPVGAPRGWDSVEA